MRSAPKFGGRRDVVAGAVLGLESVPDGLANGLLAGVNPVAGLDAYLFGAARVTGSSFMVVQGTGVMAAIVSDIGLGSRPDPERALFTLSVVTGGVLIAAGLLRASEALRLVSMAVMVGFMGAVGVNIVLGQLETVTGYATVVAGAVMAVVILVGAGAVRLIAMPSLAALLIVIGVRTVKPERMLSAIRTGRIEAVVVTTIVLTMIVPLQYSVLVGVGISVILHVVRTPQR